MDWKKTLKLIPEGVCTLSKRECCHVSGIYPKYIIKGEGSKIFDEEGKNYIDYPCSLGAVILGHAYPDVVDAVSKQIKTGTIFSLSHPLETELAELIRDIIPSIETMRFVKTGSEACQAAVKIARAYTGREPLLTCGYHGWHEWYNCATPKNAGSIKQDVTPIEWGDTKKLEQLLIKKKPAAFITEPYIYEDEKKVEKWLKECRKLCSANKVLLIFDENVTGFRTKKLSAQAYWKVTPDLTCLGKAMANGIPMACVGGKREIMDVLKKGCFVSSTFGGDLIGISAAIATIKKLKHSALINTIWIMGDKLKTAFNQAAQSIMQHEVKCIGLAPRTHFLFPTAAHKSLFWTYCLQKGIFFGHAQFISASHSLIDIDNTASVMRYAMKILNKNWDKPEEVLKEMGGIPAEETLRLVSVPAPEKETKGKK